MIQVSAISVHGISKIETDTLRLSHTIIKLRDSEKNFPLSRLTEGTQITYDERTAKCKYRYLKKRLEFF